MDSGVWDCVESAGPVAGTTTSRFGLILTHTRSEGSRLGRLFDRGPKEHLKWAWADCPMPGATANMNTYEARRGMAAAYCQMKGPRTSGSRSITPTFDDTPNGVRAFSYKSQEWVDDADWVARYSGNPSSVQASISNPISQGWAAATASTDLGSVDAVTGRYTSWGVSFSFMCFDSERCNPFGIKDTQLTGTSSAYETNAFTVWTGSYASHLNIFDSSNRQFHGWYQQQYTVGMSLVSFFFDGTRYYVRVNGVGADDSAANHPNYKFPTSQLPAALTGGTSMLQMSTFTGLLKNFRIFVNTGLPDDENYHMDREMERLELFGGHLTGPMLRVKQAQLTTRSFSMQFTVVLGGVSVEGEEATLIQVGDGARGVSLPEVALTSDLRLKACYSTDNTDATRTSCVQTDPLVTGASYNTPGWPWSVEYSGSYGTSSRTSIRSSSGYRVSLTWIVDSATGVGRWDTTEHTGGWRLNNQGGDDPAYWEFGCHNKESTNQHCSDPDIRLTWHVVPGTAAELPQSHQTWGSTEPVGVPGPLRRTPGHANAYLRSFKYMPSGLGYHIDTSRVSPDFDSAVVRGQNACPWLVSHAVYSNQTCYECLYPLEPCRLWTAFQALVQAGAWMQNGAAREQRDLPHRRDCLSLSIVSVIQLPLAF